MSAKGSVTRLPSLSDISIQNIFGDTLRVSGQKLADNQISKIVLFSNASDSIAVAVSPINPAPKYLQILGRIVKEGDLETARRMLGGIGEIISDSAIWNESNSHMALANGERSACAASIIFKHSNTLYWVGRSSGLSLPFPNPANLRAVTNHMGCHQQVVCNDTNFLVKGSLRF